MTLLDEAGPGTGPPPRERRRVVPLLVGLAVTLVVVSALVVGLVLGAGRLLDLGGPADYTGEGSGSVRVEVPEGGTLTSLASTLVDLDVVASREAFLTAARADERASSLVPGTYELAEQMSSQAALDTILDPASRQVRSVTVPEGLSLQQIVDLLVEDGFDRAEVGAAVSDRAALGLPEWAGDAVEGLLFPATYEVEPGDTAADLVGQMADAFTARAQALDLEARAREQGRAPLDVVIAASLAQAEARDPEDYRRVVRVMLNRVEVGMPLQFDSTVNYALPPDERGNPTLDQLQVDSEYNTYQNTGLPPTPIGAAGEDALEAALDPADGEWVYFITINSRTGETLFFEDYDEFINEKNALKERREQGDPTASFDRD